MFLLAQSRILVSLMFIYILVVYVLITLVSRRVHADDAGKVYGLRASLDLRDGGNMATFKHFSQLTVSVSSSFRNCSEHEATKGFVPSGHPDEARF